MGRNPAEVPQLICKLTVLPEEEQQRKMSTLSGNPTIAAVQGTGFQSALSLEEQTDELGKWPFEIT